MARPGIALAEEQWALSSKHEILGCAKPRLAGRRQGFQYSAFEFFRDLMDSLTQKDLKDGEDSDI